MKKVVGKKRKEKDIYIYIYIYIYIKENLNQMCSKSAQYKCRVNYKYI